MKTNRIYQPGELQRVRRQFERLLARTTSESEWQKFFTECPYVLSESLPLRLEARDIIPMARPGKSDPDFIFYPHEQRQVPFFGVIELKRPDSRIVTVTRANVAVLSRDAETAVEQGKVYCSSLKAQLVKSVDEFLFLGNDSYIFIIMGTSKELAAKIADDVLYAMIQNKLPKNVQILPYDVLLRRFERCIPPKLYILVPNVEASAYSGVKGVIVRKPSDEEVKTYKAWPIWKCEPSTFDWTYTEKETCLLVEGKVTVTDGKDSVSFGPGDLVVFPEELECTWRIHEAVTKHYNFG